MQLGFIGLGRMGLNMVTRLLDGGHELVVYNRTAAKMSIAEQQGAKTSKDLSGLVRQLDAPRVIWLMLPAGQVTVDHVHALKLVLSPGDIVIDGGNACYKHSMQAAADLAIDQIHFLDIGVSGGIWGLEKGYCLMAGGEENIFQHVFPILKTLAPSGGCEYVGPQGAGHFVKMIHNGIEYALLQAYGEGFELLQAKTDFNISLKKVARLWKHGSVVRSWLLELIEKTLQEDETLSAVSDYVEDSGEGRWTVSEAIDLNVPAPTITLSLLERLRSRQTSSFSAKIIAALRKAFGGHAVKSKSDRV